MTASVLGLHHVTATVGDAQSDLDFYAGALGLRLVKKTVNFDNHGVYHFYYGDAVGTPGTLMTTFPYRGKGVRAGRKGAGQITSIRFSVPGSSLDDWRRRLREWKLDLESEGTRFGENYLRASDPSGLFIELTGADNDDREPWVTTDIDASIALRGLHTLELTVANPSRTIEFLGELLGFRVAGEEGDRTRVAVGPGGPGTTLEILDAHGVPPAINGLGTVHHLALAVPSSVEQLAYREEVLRRGIPVTPVMDRQYFQSIYFREPGGVLLEIATMGPGFRVDETREHLGEGLKLPPWEEINRALIEAELPSVVLPGSP